MKVIGEMGTVTVRDGTGKILHFGHHFTSRELLTLFARFRLLRFEEDVSSSYYHRNWVKGYVVLAEKRAK